MTLSNMVDLLGIYIFTTQNTSQPNVAASEQAVPQAAAVNSPPAPLPSAQRTVQPGAASEQWQAPPAPIPANPARMPLSAPVPPRIAQSDASISERRVIAVWAGTVVAGLGSADGIASGNMLVAQMSDQPVSDPRDPAVVLGYEVTNLRVEKTDQMLALCRPVNTTDRLPRVRDAVQVISAP
jgi:hypothetical protein